MYTFWASHRWAIVTFVTICAAFLVFPVVMKMTAEYYTSHPVIIPIWARTLMLTGAIVRMFSLPIIFAAAVVLFGISLAATSRTAIRRVPLKREKASTALQTPPAQP